MIPLDKEGNYTEEKSTTSFCQHCLTWHPLSYDWRYSSQAHKKNISIAPRDVTFLQYSDFTAIAFPCCFYWHLCRQKICLKGCRFEVRQEKMSHAQNCAQRVFPPTSAWPRGGQTFLEEKIIRGGIFDRRQETNQAYWLVGGYNVATLLGPVAPSVVKRQFSLINDEIMAQTGRKKRIKRQHKTYPLCPSFLIASH